MCGFIVVMDYISGPLTTRDVALIFGVTGTTVKRWAELGIIPSFRTAGGHYRFRAEDVEAFKASMTTTAATTPVAS